MAITFESIRDPYGLGAASQAIGNAYLQRSMMDLQQQKQREEEARQRQLLQKGYSALGQTLQEFAPKAPGEIWDESRIANFMSTALESGASMNDIVNAIKAFQTQKKPAAAQSPFSREMAKKNVKMLEEYREKGQTAKDMLARWDTLDAAINDPERADNIAARTLKSIPGASLTYGPSDQTIQTFAKELITNFSNQKGLRLTDAKLRWLESVAPAPWKSREANQEASAHFKRLAQISEAYGDISSNLSNAYAEAGLDLPPNFDKILDDAIKPLRDEIDQMYKIRDKSQTIGEPQGEIGTTFKKMPDPRKYEGAEITDNKGIKYVSTGTKWRKVK